MEQSLEKLVRQAQEGNKASLEELVKLVKDRVNGLALRMVWHPEDAADCTQEILIKVITNLSGFRHESSFTTWVYRIASNYLLTARKRRAEMQDINFEMFAVQLENGRSSSYEEPHSVERRLLVEEAKVGCMQGMLLCLDREHRAAYILGEIMELSSHDGGLALQISPEAFRKRLSRARARITEFMLSNCGLAEQRNSCRCSHQVDQAVRAGRINRDRLLFADHAVLERKDILDQVQKMDKLERSVVLFRSHPDYSSPQYIQDYIQKLFDSKSLVGENDVPKH